ncbi:hypothetical protein AAC387_Pa06g1829 [Persea americana]
MSTRHTGGASANWEQIWPQGIVPVYPVDRPGGLVDRTVYPAFCPTCQMFGKMSAVYPVNRVDHDVDRGHCRR